MTNDNFPPGCGASDFDAWDLGCCDRCGRILYDDVASGDKNPGPQGEYLCARCDQEESDA